MSQPQGIPRHVVIADLKKQIATFEARLTTNQTCFATMNQARAGLVVNTANGPQYKSGLDSIPCLVAALDSILLVQLSTMTDNMRELNAALDQLRMALKQADSPIHQAAPVITR